jgi:hypothetical protein
MGKMIVSAWNNGSFKETGAGYGLRIRKKDRDHYFQRHWDSVIIITADNEITVNISPSFWKECIEIRSSKIGKWLLDNGHRTWPKGKPPKYELVHLKEKKFALREFE